MRANEFILSEKRRRRKKSRRLYGVGWFGYPAIDSSDSGGGDGGGVAETQEDIENNLPSIELARNNIAKILQAAQRIYDDWDEADRDTYAGGGICHLIADAICDVMGEIGIDCTPVSCSYEQHVYVAVRVAEGVYTIDIPYSIYETGGVYSWKKIPDIQFDSRDVVFYRTSGDPDDFEKNYASLEEATDNILRLRRNAGDGHAQKFIDAVYARYPDTFQNNHVMSWGSGEQQEIALFELVPNIARPNAVDIKWIQAYPLRKGIGSRAMEILQSMAQEHSVALTLYPWDKGQVSQSKLIKFYRQMGFRPTSKGSKNMIWQGVAEGKVKLYTDPDYFGAEVDDSGFDSLPVVNIPANQLVGFEPDDKMNQPKSKANVKKIVAGLEKGDRLPPILVRKYKNGYQVLDGHHRFWAYKLLKIKSIPARIVPAKDIEEIAEQGVAENITPKDIHHLADRKGIAWDNEPSFLKLTKKLTGKTHLDDLNQVELKKIKNHLQKKLNNYKLQEVGPVKIAGQVAAAHNSATDVVSRFKRGDIAGAGIGALSAIANLKPGIGTAVSMGLDYINDQRDKKAAENQAAAYLDGVESGIAGNNPAAGQNKIQPAGPDAPMQENFADGKNPGRRGLAKRMGVPTKASVSKLRQIAKSSSGEKQRMAHWLANMKAGKKK